MNSLCGRPDKKEKRKRKRKRKKGKKESILRQDAFSLQRAWHTF